MDVTHDVALGHCWHDVMAMHQALLLRQLTTHNLMVGAADIIMVAVWPHNLSGISHLPIIFTPRLANVHRVRRYSIMFCDVLAGWLSPVMLDHMWIKIGERAAPSLGSRMSARRDPARL